MTEAKTKVQVKVGIEKRLEIPEIWGDLFPDSLHGGVWIQKTWNNNNNKTNLTVSED